MRDITCMAKSECPPDRKSFPHPHLIDCIHLRQIAATISSFRSAAFCFSLPLLRLRQRLPVDFPLGVFGRPSNITNFEGSM